LLLATGTERLSDQDGDSIAFSAETLECVELYIHVSVHLHGIVTTLPNFQ